MEDNTTPHGVWIDIFPEDNLPDGELSRKIYVAYGKFLRDTIIAMTIDFSASNLGKKRYIKRILWCFANIVGKNRILRAFNKHATKLSKKKTKYVACLATPYGTKVIMKRTELFVADTYKFESENFKGPKNYNMYLSNLYGDYMKLPPVEKRRIHGIEAWWL